MQFKIRDATKRDLIEMVEIERLAFPRPWSLDSFVRELSLPFSRLIVATSSRSDQELSSLAGYLCRWLVSDECHVLNIAVHPKLRRLGVGARLMSDVIAEARAKKVEIVTLEVRRGNLPARGLYRKFNFEERRLRRNYYGPGEDALVMELKLG